MSKIISSRYVLNKTHSECLKPHPQQPISAENAWGVKSPEEKHWIENHRPGITAAPKIESPERVKELEKQLQALMFVRREKIDLANKLGGLRTRHRQLQNKFDAAQIRIQQLEGERNYYYARQSSRFNSVRKESGLPTLPPASPSE